MSTALVTRELLQIGESDTPEDSLARSLSAPDRNGDYEYFGDETVALRAALLMARQREQPHRREPASTR